MSLKCFEAESQWFNEEKRLDASSYSPEAAKSTVLIEKLKARQVTIDSLDNLTNRIFYPGRFKRILSADGDILLSSKDMFDFLLRGKRISNISEDYSVKPGWIFVTRSGSVGRVLLANKFVGNKAISEHVIRIIPNEDTPVCYIYAYLLSSIGRPLITKSIFGGVVDEIEPQHIGSIPIPRVPELEKEIENSIREVYRLREEAQELVLRSEATIYSELGLMKISEADVDYLTDKNTKILKCFETSANALATRLDASFHAPMAHQALRNLKESMSGQMMKLEEVADSFVPPRFKRNYVEDPSNGVPLLQGTQIPQITAQNLKYIWRGMKKLDSYIVKKNWILVTCSGTIGQISMARSLWDGWAATNHLLRVVPDENQIHPGYLAAFLLSVYGQVQFQRLAYGGVVDEIGEAGELFQDIQILKPLDEAVEKRIGNLILDAYDKRDEANVMESKAVKYLEERLDEVADSELR